MKMRIKGVPPVYPATETALGLPSKSEGKVYCGECHEFVSSSTFYDCFYGRESCKQDSSTDRPSGGPSNYYDMPFSEWVTTNDMMEHLAEHKWGKFGIHLKDIFKGLCRWGGKGGTTTEYDTKKIIYYGVRVLQLIVGRTKMREYLKELLNDPQFKE